MIIENALGNFHTQSPQHQVIGSPTQLIFLPNYEYGSMMGNFQFTPFLNCFSGGANFVDNNNNNIFGSFTTMNTGNQPNNINQLNSQNSLNFSSNQFNFDAKSMGNALQLTNPKKLDQDFHHDSSNSSAVKNKIGFVRSRASSGNCFNHGENHE
jgi:hypothetical protein